MMDERDVWRPGDLVFAKMHGYPAWPARVEFQKGSLQSVRYKVYFFGTKQMGDCKACDLHPYLTNKDILGKPKKKSRFNQGMEEIEEEYKMNEMNKKNASASHPVGANRTQDNKSEASTSGVSRKRKAEEIDSKTRIALLKPCFVKINRVTVPASGIVRVISSPSNTVTSGPTLSSSDNSVAPRQDSTSKSEVQVRKVIKPVHVKSSDVSSNLKTHTAKNVATPLNSDLSSQPLNSNTVSTPPKNVVFTNLGLIPASTPVDAHMIQPEKLMSKPAIRLTSKLVAHKPRILSRNKPKPKKMPQSETPHEDSCSPISISELAHVHPTSNTIDVYEDDYNPQYQCIFCDSDFYNFDQLHTHTSNFHGKYSFCRKCKKYFKSSKLLMLHEAMCLSTHAKLIFHCNCCDKSFVSKEFLLEHLRNYHTVDNTSNNYLTVLSTIKDELKKRTKNHVNAPCLIDCHMCKRPFTIDEYITTHLEQSFAITRCHCSFCGVDPSIYYLEPIKYLQHVREHILHDFMTVRCDKCGIKLISKYNGFTHMLHSHSNDVEKGASEDCSDAETTTEEPSEPQNIIQTDEVTTTEASMIEPRITSTFSDSSITSELEVSEYILEVYEADTVEDTECTKKVEDSCNLLKWMDITQHGTDKPKSQFLVNCTVCSTDVQDITFEEHIKDCAKDELFSCPLCGVDILAIDNAHIKSHLKQQMDLIKCRKCNSMFFNHHNQALHLTNKHYNIFKD